jgi:hypothetical protein
MFAPAGFGGSVQSMNSGTVFVQSNGTVSINPADANDFIKLGFKFATTVHRSYNTPGAPAASSPSVTVSSTSLSAGPTTLTIAAQPDVPRQLAVLLNMTGTLTAGSLGLTYTANDGTTQTDIFNFAGTVTSATQYTSKGVEHLTSGTIYASAAGGSAQVIQIGTNNVLALPLDTSFTSLSVTKETKITPTAGTLGLSVPADETVGTLVVASGLITPTTVPDGTHGLSFGYSYIYPG